MVKVISFLITLLFFISCDNSPVNSSGEKAFTADELTRVLNELSGKHIFNGFAVSIVDSEGTIYQRGFGDADKEAKIKYSDSTIQNIGSISKTFVGMALLKAQELGALKLDDAVNKYLPFKVYNPKFPNKEITLRHLATHTSGIQDNKFYLTKNYYLKKDQPLNGINQVFDDMQVFNPYDSALAMEDFLRNLLAEDGKWNQGIFSDRETGSFYEYSNTGTTLAAYVIELATHQPFNAFTTAHILNPLKMNSSGWKFEDIDFSRHSRLYETPQRILPYYAMASYPDGNLITSIHDLSLYLTELIKGYNGKGTLLSKDGYAELFKQQLSEKNFTERNDKNPYSESYNVGIFMGFGVTGYVGHTGGDPGVASMMFFDPKTGTGRCLMVNTSIMDKKGNDAFYAIWDKLDLYIRHYKRGPH